MWSECRRRETQALFGFVQLGQETYFRMKPTTKMKKIFDAYAHRNSVSSSALSFLLDGTRIRENDEMVRGLFRIGSSQAILKGPLASQLELEKTRTRSIVRLKRLGFSDYPVKPYKNKHSHFDGLHIWIQHLLT